MDKNFTDKIPDMIQPLAWYLIQRWKTINKLEQFIPEKVRAATNIYKQENNLYHQFDQQCIFEKKDARLTPATLYSHFKEWCKEECPSYAINSRNNVKQHFIKLWGDLDNGKYWLHKTCRQPIDNDDNIINPML
jgi:phage/plasmid-associated DNA primase